ncbi:MAG: peptidase M48, partial [Cyanobacteria bacterium P01_F01_bin.42]
AKFTADRAGLLACQSLDVAISSLIKLAGLPSRHVNDVTIAEFKQQALDFDDNSVNKLDKVAKTLSFMEHTYPWSIIRASELLKWVETGDYDSIIGKNSALTTGDDDPPHWNFLSGW